MFSTSPPAGLPDYREWAVWLITIALVAFGFRYAKDIIAFMLDKLYEFFIQDNPII